MTRTIRTALAATLALATATAAASPLTVTATVGGGPLAGATYANFDNVTLGTAGGTSAGIGIAFAGTGGGAVQGSLGGRYAAPYLSNGQGTAFGDSANGLDTTTYLASGIGSVTLTFAGEEQYLGLLWGSVDTYNTLSFYDGTTLVGSVTGLNVQANADGNQGATGTYYVNVTSATGFNRVVASSTSFAFEFDNVAYRPMPSVPEPGALGLLGAGLVATGLVRRRRR